MRFSELANQILNYTTLNKGTARYRICEIEFYLYNDTHQDNYVHKDRGQMLNKTLYFHKRGGTYKEGTYKGLDLTFGLPSKNQYFGVLIRSIARIHDNNELGKFIEGPCNCVNELIHSYNKVDDFMVGKGPYLIFDNRHIKVVIEDDLPVETIYKGRRYGLSDKYPKYKDKKYRFLIHKDKIKKQKSDLQPI